MKEASLVKFYLVRYFFLAFGLLVGLAATMLFLQFPDTPKNRFAIFVLFTLAMVLFSVHFLVFSKVKRVAMSKKKISVTLGYRTKQFDWDDVKELKLIHFLNMYSLKLKGKKRIYFLPAHDSAALFGLFPDEPEFLPKKMSKA
jgi:heme/copper-type cytochrome/quinol oxidase subunit 4